MYQYNGYSSVNHSLVQKELSSDLEKWILTIAMIVSNDTIPIAMMKMIAVMIRTASVIGIKNDKGSNELSVDWVDGRRGILCIDP